MSVTVFCANHSFFPHITIFIAVLCHVHFRDSVILVC